MSDQMQSPDDAALHPALPIGVLRLLRAAALLLEAGACGQLAALKGWSSHPHCNTCWNTSATMVSCMRQMRVSCKENSATTFLRSHHFRGITQWGKALLQMAKAGPQDSPDAP